MGNAKSLVLKSKLRKLNPKTVAELQKHIDIDFTHEEIEEWYREFNTNLDKGMTKLTVKEFKKVYNSVFDGDASSFVEHLFRSFDTDGDGHVDFKEFIVGLCLSSSENSEKKLRWAFNMYDIDGSGGISRDEMGQVLKSIYKMTNSLADGEMGSPEQLTETFFEKYDLNKDDQISFEEFSNGALNDPTIVHLLMCDPGTEN